jgi:hypothetical protein
MNVSFVRHRGERDRIYVVRTSGGEVSWEFPTYGDRLPHDLVHLVVEAAFDVREGFWGRVDAGVDLARANAAANRTGGPDKYDGFGASLDEILVAEALAAAPWSDADATDGRCVESVIAACVEYGVAVPRTMSLARVAEVRSVLADLEHRWASFAARGAIDLSFDRRDLEATFHAMSLVCRRPPGGDAVPRTDLRSPPRA